MNLLQRTTELSDGLSRFRVLQLSAQSTAVIAQRVSELEEARLRLESPLAFLRALRSHPEFDRIGMESVDLQAASTSVTKARTAIEANPDSAVKGTAVSPVLGALKQAVAAAEGAATVAWRQVTATVPQTARTDLLDVLSQVPSYRQGADRMRVLDARIRALSALRWPTDAQLEDFLVTRRQSEEEWSQLGGSDAVPPGVMDFLIACAKSGAALDEITPEVSEWIDQRGLRDAFRVRFSGG